MQKYTYIIWQIVEVGIIFTGYKYSINTRRAERVYWRCVLRQCVATLITLNDILMSLGQNHNHTADVVSLAADIFVYQVKKRCREHVTPMPIIYDEEVGCLSDRDYDEDVGEMIRKIPTFERCRGSLYRSRSKLIPKLPVSDEGHNCFIIIFFTVATYNNSSYFLVSYRSMSPTTKENIRHIYQPV